MKFAQACGVQSIKLKVRANNQPSKWIKMDCKDYSSYPKSLSQWDLLPHDEKDEKDENKHLW